MGGSLNRFSEKYEDVTRQKKLLGENSPATYNLPSQLHTVFFFFVSFRSAVVRSNSRKISNTIIASWFVYFWFFFWMNENLHRHQIPVFLVFIKTGPGRQDLGGRTQAARPRRQDPGGRKLGGGRTQEAGPRCRTSLLTQVTTRTYKNISDGIKVT